MTERTTIVNEKLVRQVLEEQGYHLPATFEVPTDALIRHVAEVADQQKHVSQAHRFAIAVCRTWGEIAATAAKIDTEAHGALHWLKQHFSLRDLVHAVAFLLLLLMLFLTRGHSQEPGVKLQIQQAGTPIKTWNNRLAIIDCSTNVTCTPSGNKVVITASSGAPPGSGITTLNGLTSDPQTFAKTDDTNVTLTITSAVSTHTFGLGWTGTLAKSRTLTSTVYTDQTNTFGAFVQTFQAGANHLLVDPTDTTKKFQFDVSNVATGTTRTVNIPNANSTTVQADTGAVNNFLTAISAQGVVSKAQPAFTNISGTVTDAQLANNYSGVGTCTNQFARVLNDNAAPTCATVLVADVTTVLKTGMFGFIMGAKNAAAALAAADDEDTIWINGFAQGVTLDEIYCEADAGATTVNFQRDDGTPANILTSDLTLAAAGACSRATAVASTINSAVTCVATLSGTEKALSAGHRVDWLTATADGTTKAARCFFKYTLD